MLDREYVWLALYSSLLVAGRSIRDAARDADMAFGEYEFREKEWGDQDRETIAKRRAMSKK